MRERINIEDITLLLTGCIDAVKEQSFHVLRDQEVRYDQYLKSIEWAIKDTKLIKIVFCENSDFFCRNSDKMEDIQKLKSVALQCGKDLEVLSFQGDAQRVLETNKGYGEGEIIEYALQKSQLLQNSQYFCKLTGRLIVRNIDATLAHIVGGINYFNRDRSHENNWVDTRFFCCEKNFYEMHLIHLYQKLTKYMIIEKLFYNELKSRRDWRSTYQYPDYEGKSGATGREYRDDNSFRMFFFNGLCKLNLYNGVYIPLHYKFIAFKVKAYAALKPYRF